MQTMKRIYPLALSLVIVIFLAGCGKSDARIACESQIEQAIKVAKAAGLTEQQIKENPLMQANQERCKTL